MIGFVPKILVDMVLENADEATLREIFKQSGIEEDRIFHMNEYYEDTEWQRLFKSTLSVLHISESKACEFYADCFCRFATAKFPVWFEKAKTAYEFLCLQPIIHNGFATGLVDVSQRKKVTDKFVLEQHENELIMHYRSPNQLCLLYEALAKWLLNYYGDTAEITQTRCLKHGDAECEIHVKW